MAGISAEPAYIPRKKKEKKKKLLNTRSRNLVSKVSYGVTPALAAEVRKRGGADQWFERQLDPSRGRDTYADGIKAWWPSLSRSASSLWQRHIAGVEYGWEVMGDYQRYLLMRRIHTKREVLEIMTEFWENHLNVPVTGDAVWTHRVSYGHTIRKHALGRFDAMLNAAITHPAMLIYLDGAVSTKRHPNENLGRELLELHTVGRGNYDEDDVKSSARILTGWHVDMWDTWVPSYETEDHWTGPVRVMGFADANASPDGRAVTKRYLDFLARHPATAKRLARKLCVKFIGDHPSPALVDQLARIYLKHDTEIKPVLRALVASTAFKQSVGAKVRDPVEDVVATYRALGLKVARPPQGVPDDHAAHVILWQCNDLGMEPVAWPQPNGAPPTTTRGPRPRGWWPRWRCTGQ